MIGKKVKLTIAPNPSHLETVGPVVEGITRGRIDLRYDGNSKKIVPIVIHGDASIAGQGVVYEVAQMSELEGYSTGGSIHIVVNNQIGFTTNYLEARSSTYCTDVAKVTQSPILHVNGDDVEAVVYAMQFAMEYRNRFGKDIYIDLLCYRKFGHNEGDEPRFTQPILYKAIEKHKNPRDIYINKLQEESPEIAARKGEIEDEFNALLEANLEEAKDVDRAHIENFLETTWKDYRKAVPEDFEQSITTAYNLDHFNELCDKLVSLPEDKKFYRKTIKLNKDRQSMIENDKFDWAMGELSAYGSLLQEGVNVRLSGQDSQRGTFSHRHAVLTVEDSEERYVPLKNLSDDQAKFSVFNSPLSEYGVLGFEYGYALATPKSLTIWEAQFGDFFNGAQIILDQYLNSAEDKWGVMNHLVMFLPHGYEGQGPEHSSARIERFMTLCAENNMQIANVSTPANLFHLLRRQVKRDIRKPLIVFTPKSLLRHPKCTSTREEFTNGGFKEIIDDPNVNPEKVNRVILSSGKIYYDLLAEKQKLNTEEVALVRVEQLYPLPEKQIMELFDKYPKSATHLWVQEEPINMGPWPYIHDNFEEANFKVIARPPSGSPATGSSKFHSIQQKKIIDKAFHQCDCHRLDMECKMMCIGNRWRQFEQEVLERKENN
jgi:2-oxoglutarate dehydrogenase E1 component